MKYLGSRKKTYHQIFFNRDRSKQTESSNKNQRNPIRDGYNADDNIYYRRVKALMKTIPEWGDDSFFHDNTESDKNNNEQNIIREQNWIRLEILGEPLCDLYSWAIPDERSLNILSKFNPLIEIGSGKGYWARLLKDRGIDIISFDKYIYNDTSLRYDSKKNQCVRSLKSNQINMWTTVYKGGPSILKRNVSKGRNLFLCYPDEGENMAVECLNNFQGDFIIHVGELITTGTLSGYPQAPFGRTSSSDFNVLLTSSFHCILSASIPRFPFSNDCITVWKRTKYVEGRKNEDTDDKNYWADIPTNEKLPTDIAAPCCVDLLR